MRSTQSARVLAFIRSHPGCTALDIAHGLDPWCSNPRARISDLRAAGFVIEPTKRSDGKTGFVVRERSVTQGEQVGMTFPVHPSERNYAPGDNR